MIHAWLLMYSKKLRQKVWEIMKKLYQVIVTRDELSLVDNVLTGFFLAKIIFIYKHGIFRQNLPTNFKTAK